MAFFTADSFIKNDISYNNNYPLSVCFNIPAISDIRVNMKDLINGFHRGLSIRGNKESGYWFDETINGGLKYRQLVASSCSFRNSHIIIPYMDAFSDIQECLTVNSGNMTTLISLFVKFYHRIQLDKLYDLRNMLLSYKSLARKDIKEDEEYEFILGVERVFGMRKMCLTSGVAGSDLSLDGQREGIINGIVYTLSVLHGSPDPFFYKNIPSEWKGRDFHSYVYAYIKQLRKVKFLYDGTEIRLGDIVNGITSNIDTLWKSVYGGIMSRIDECKRAKLKCSTDGVYLTYDDKLKSFKIEESNGASIVIDTIMDLEMLKDTVPSFLPVVLQGTPNLVSTMGMSNGFTMKSDDTTRVSCFGTSPKDGMFVMKIVTNVTTIFDVFELFTEYFLSNIVHTCEELKDVRSSIPMIYAFRSDIKFDREGELYTHKTRTMPCSLIMERKEGSTLHGICKYLSKEDLVKVLVSVFKVLDKLYKVLDFTHYDLHGGNIIVDTETLEVSLIDMSRSHFNYNGVWMGRYFDVNTMHFTGIMPDRSYPANDIFRLIMSCWAAGHTYLDTIIVSLFGMDASAVNGMYSHSIYSIDYSEKYKGIVYQDVLSLLESLKL